MSLPFVLEGVTVHRGGTAAVVDLSYANDDAAWIGLVGANGSGKTSLLRALAGRLAIRAGRVVIGGADLSWDRGERARLIGFAVEQSVLPGELSVREVFAIAGEAADAADDPRLRGLREALNLDSFIDRKCGSLSAGMGQRAALLAAFLGLPPIVILDEPFNWLDPLTAFDVKKALRALVTQESVTLITALHDVATLMAYCHRGLLLSAGRIALKIEQAALREGLSDPVAFEARMVEQLRAVR